MMLGDSGGGGRSGGFGEEDKFGVEESERSGGGNRWPRQETLALLKIRSDMDAAFRDSSLKGPLWEEVARKMGELDYQRNPKKCKEKFENVYKYHKRTKEGRSSKPDAKTYKFFDQLQALEHNPQPPPAPSSQPPAPPPLTTTTPPIAAHVIPLSTGLQGTNTPINFSHQPAMHTIDPPRPDVSARNISTSSSTSSDERRHRRKKRKWMEYFERLMRDIIEKQEELQKIFLETLEKHQRDRMAREEAWRAQEMAKMNKERELLVQERSIAAAKDSAVIAFLQKITGNQNLQIPSTAVAPPPAAPATVGVHKLTDNSGENCILASSSRWPKTEVQALIKLRTDLDLKYQEGGPKGLLWEEISAAMAKFGYNRSAKRCKEKWENINKYFKKVKEGNKRRPEDSKTCPYFEQLDSIYRERAKNEPSSIRPMVPLMAVPEQQWPTEHRQESGFDDDNDQTDHDDNDDGVDDDEDEGGQYEIVTNKQPTSVTTNTTTPTTFK